MISSDLRKLLQKHGLDSMLTSMAPSSLLLPLATCASFLPNHVSGVVSQVLKTSSAVERCKSQGWDYLEKPIRSLLTSRTTAQRPAGIVSVPEDTAFAGPVLRMLASDMNYEETVMFLVEIPKLVRSAEQLSEAIKVCRERDARTVYYLRGVLQKGEQRRETKRREILSERSEQEPWRPGDYQAPGAAAIDELESRWQSLDHDIDFLRESS